MQSREALKEQFDRGAPVPPVEPVDMRTMWEGMQRTLKLLAERGRPTEPFGPGPDGQIRGVGIDPTILFPEEIRNGPGFAVELDYLIHRYWLLSALVARGVLREHQDGEQLGEDVFRAAATVPMSKDDVAEAMILAHLSKLPDQERREQAKQEMLAQGYNPDEPNIDRKFLGWMRERRR